MISSQLIRRTVLSSAIILSGLSAGGCMNDQGTNSTTNADLAREAAPDKRDAPFTPTDERITPSSGTGANRQTPPFTPSDERTTPSAPRGTSSGSTGGVEGSGTAPTP